MKKLLCWLFHRRYHVCDTVYGQFGRWQCKCEKCGRKWREFEA